MVAGQERVIARPFAAVVSAGDLMRICMSLAYDYQGFAEFTFTSATAVLHTSHIDDSARCHGFTAQLIFITFDSFDCTLLSVYCCLYHCSRFRFTHVSHGVRWHI